MSPLKGPKISFMSFEGKIRTTMKTEYKVKTIYDNKGKKAPN